MFLLAWSKSILQQWTLRDPHRMGESFPAGRHFSPSIPPHSWLTSKNRMAYEWFPDLVSVSLTFTSFILFSVDTFSSSFFRLRSSISLKTNRHFKDDSFREVSKPTVSSPPACCWSGCTCWGWPLLTRCCCCWRSQPPYLRSPPRWWAACFCCCRCCCRAPRQWWPPSCLPPPPPPRCWMPPPRCHSSWGSPSLEVAEVGDTRHPRLSLMPPRHQIQNLEPSWWDQAV